MNMMNPFQALIYEYKIGLTFHYNFEELIELLNIEYAHFICKYTLFTLSNT